LEQRTGGKYSYEGGFFNFEGRRASITNGFLTSEDRFVSREEALAIAKQARQVKMTTSMGWLDAGMPVREAEVKPPRRWLVTIPTSGSTPWRKVVVTATSEEAAWYQAYGQSARYFRLSRSKYGDTRVVVLKKLPSNGVAGYIDPILPEA